MRKDMAKVVTERPRVNHGELSAKTGKRIWGKDAPHWEDEDYDSGRTWRKVSRLGGCMDRKGSGDCHKSFSDLLGPLRGYLRKQVGRPWDDVYSELCATLNRRSLSGIHIWGHVQSEVKFNCYVSADGAIYERGRFGSGVPVYGLYVHPLTHVLCDADPDNRLYSYRSRFPCRPKPVTEIKLDDSGAHRLMQIKGLWFECWIVKCETFKSVKRSDGPAIIVRVTEMVDRKRQLSRKELREHGLRNVR